MNPPDVYTETEPMMHCTTLLYLLLRVMEYVKVHRLLLLSSVTFPDLLVHEAFIYKVDLLTAE